jgi:hypothetical protein
MAENVTASDYEKLTISELEAAARSQTPEARRTHLDQAGRESAQSSADRSLVDAKAICHENLAAAPAH